MKGYKVNLRPLIGVALVIAIVAGVAMVLVPQIQKEMAQRQGLDLTPRTAGASLPVAPSGGVAASKSKLVRITLDEWIGWKSLLDANGGLITQPNSIYDKLGLNIEFVVTNDAVASSNALIKGEVSGAGYTINRYAFLQDKFDKANLKVTMPYITNYSNGGDGIIAKSTIKKVEDLVDKKIAIPRFSEAHTMLEWLLQNSQLTAEQQNRIRTNLVMFESPEDAGRAFFAGHVDAAATWEPFLTEAKNQAGSHILFSTAMSTNLILDGIVFRQDFAAQNHDFIVKLIDGSLQASSQYNTNFANIRQMPGFSLMTDAEIREMAASAKLATWVNNKELLSGEAVLVYRDMANIWLAIGEKAYPEKADSAFDGLYLLALADKYETIIALQEAEAAKPSFTQDQRDKAKDEEALLKITLSINFEPDRAAILPDSYEELNKFAETAKVLNNVMIQIEGNTANDGSGANSGRELSEARAAAVATYLKAQGVSPSRFIIVGNGAAKPVGDNSVEAGRVLNRRTDLFFKVG